MNPKTEITLTVNGVDYTVTVEPRDRLLDVLRYRLGITGPKEGCGTADCGACTVLLEGKPVTACMVLAVSANGASLVTVEGLADRGTLHPVQQCFMEQGGLQCGICTPGFLLNTYALLQENPNPSLDQVRFYLAGNLCRCTGYTKVFESVLAAAEQMRAAAAPQSSN